MKQINFLPLFILLFWFFPSSYSFALSCQQVDYIQKLFLRHHILYTKLTPILKNKVLNQFIENLDNNKIYFLKSDIYNIKRKNKNLFADIKRQNCRGLYYIYDIYSKRVKERLKFANKYLNTNFKFNKKIKYIIDDDLKKYSASSEEAHQKMKNYIQYQTANVFLFEKDLKKSIQQVSYMLNNSKKQVLSWKPQLNHREIRECNTKSKNSFQSCKPTKWFSNYLNAYSQSLDSHSSYMDNEDLEEFYISMKLELEGIGATLSFRFGYIVVEKLIASGAAAKSKKIKVKDKIIAVGQNKKTLVNIFGERIEDVVSIIRGPKGTPVFLQILREEKNGKNTTSVVKLIRDRVHLKEEEASISYHNIQTKGRKHNIGLLKVPSFYGSNVFGKSVTRDVKRILLQAKKKKISALVLDLSNNRGGSLDEAVDLSGLFFATGNVVKQSIKNQGKPQIFKDMDKRVFYKGPLVVLVNRLSASASEIVSGTLQNYNRAIVVGGDHTFGKGSVQSVEPVSKLGALKTTVGLYFIPSGKSTQNEGVSSDIVFPSIFNIDELGEKNMSNALPTQHINDFKSSPQELFSKGQNNWKPINQKIIKKLRQASQKRISKSKKFQKIKKRMVKIQEKSKNQKVITIAEVLKDDKEDKEDDKEESLDKEQISQTEKDTKKYFGRADIQEALNIAGDLLQSQKITQSKNKKIL